MRPPARSLPRALVAAVRRLDEAQLRRLLILARGLLLRSDGPVVELADVPGLASVSYRRQEVRCGKDCAACPHGPYWYAYWKEGGRTRSQYIGNQLPGDVRRLLGADADEQDDPGATGDQHERGTVVQLGKAAADRT